MGSSRWLRWQTSLCLAVACLVSGAAAATAQISLGVKGGLSLATWTGDDIQDVDWRRGWAGGGFATIRFGPRIAIQPEVLFVQKGVEGEIVGDPQADVELMYVEVPLLFKFLLPGGTTPASGPFLMLGPAIAFRTGCQVNLGGEGFSASVDCDQLTDPEPLPIKDSDLSAVFGGGIGFAIGTALLTFDGRYQLGLQSIDDSPAENDVKNQSFLVTAGFSIPLSPIGVAGNR